MKLLTIGDIWYRLGEVSRQDLTEAPCVVKHMEVDEESVVGGMNHLSLNPRCFLSALSTGVIDCITALPTFTVMLSIENEQDTLMEGNEK